MCNSSAAQSALGDFVWTLMRRQDLDLSQLAARSRLAPVEIAQLLAGRHTPDPEACHRLAQALGCDVLTLLYLAGHVSLATVFAAQEPGPTAHQLLIQAFRRVANCSASTQRLIVSVIWTILAEQESAVPLPPAFPPETVLPGWDSIYTLDRSGS